MEITIKLETRDEIEVFRDILKDLIEEKEAVVKKPGDSLSQYAVWFDDGCIGWTKDAEYNKAYLITQQNYCNDKLRAKGKLLLNDIFDLIGLPRTKAGMVVGWEYREDSCVDFGLGHERNADFLAGYTSKAILDFNVDGIIEY